MSLTNAVDALRENPAYRGRSFTTWQSEQDEHARKVDALRDYIDGDHPANMSPQMAQLLRVNSTDIFRELNNNYMPVIVLTMADRLSVARFDALGDTDTDAANEWAAALLSRNFFDGLQGDVHEAAIADGDTFVLVSADADGRAVLTHEPAFDGSEGMLVYYERRKQSAPSAAIKVWREPGETATTDQTVTRITVYYPDRVERYKSIDGGAPVLDGEDPGGAWVTFNGEPLGVPVVHFRNRGRSYQMYGESEIRQAVPLQNALNRTMYSLIMASELTAFQIRYAVGWQPPADMTPGMWIAINPDAPLTPEQKIDIGTLEAGQVMPYLDSARYLAGEIGRITRTPSPEFGGVNVSGEALKQHEIGLLGKVRRAQITLGNAWERCLSLAAAVEAAYAADGAPVGVRWTTRWQDAEVRNENDVIANALKVADRVGDPEFLRRIGYDEDKINQIMQERAESLAQSLALLDRVNPQMG